MKLTPTNRVNAGTKILLSQLAGRAAVARDKTMSNLALAAGVLAVILISIVASGAHAQVSKDLENLGSNSEVNRRANAIESRSRIAIVQGRTVKRDWRFELGANYGPVAAGDSYLFTQNIGGEANLHINPRFSLGVRYAKAFNNLTPEGRKRFEDARTAYQNRETYTIPQIDYPESSTMGLVNWYMFYGKMNFFDLRVVQFDIYSLAGFGTMQLASGSAPTYTAGGGIGFWLNNHLTSRFELRYQGYSDQVYTGSRDLNLIVANFGIGVLL